MSIEDRENYKKKNEYLMEKNEMKTSVIQFISKLIPEPELNCFQCFFFFFYFSSFTIQLEHFSLIVAHKMKMLLLFVMIYNFRN